MKKIKKQMKMNKQMKKAFNDLMLFSFSETHVFHSTEHLERHCQDLGTSASHGSGVSPYFFFERLQRSGVIKLSILGGNQTIQMYGHFEGFPLKS